MTRTIAEALREEGREEGAVRALQQALVVSIRAKFGRVPRATERAIREIRDPNKLQALLVRAGKATGLEEIAIVSSS